MQGFTEEEYAMKFCMLIVLDENKISGLDKYTDNFKYILESYSKLIKNHSGALILETELPTGSKLKKNAVILEEICKLGNISLILRQNSLQQSELFAMFVEALYRAVVLVHFYAPDGDILAEIIKEIYFGPKDKSEIQLCKAMHVGRSTFYRRKQQAIMFAGYFFYEVVLPEMEGKI